jgi:glycosyltransferase involved in cell wall biosynthesis
MRILIITHSYAPLISPRAFRWSAIAEYWAKQGHHVDVVCAWRPGLLEREILKGVNIYRTGGGVAELIKGRFSIKTISIKTPGNRQISDDIGLRGKAVRLVKYIHDHTWTKLYWPDYACMWYFPAAKKAVQLFVKNHYDSLITVSIPFTGHLVGLNLKKKYPHIQWVVDIGDPFCFLDQTPTNNHKLYEKLNYKCEGGIFNHADAISVTTKPTLEKYSQLFPDNAYKICVIPPLLSHANDNADATPIFSQDQKLRMVFIGTLYKNIRSPDYLLFLFSKLLNTDIGDRLELHFFGNVNDCSDSFNKYQGLLGTKMFLYGQVSSEKAIQAMKESDILINIGNSTSYQLPSKVVEYAATGNPVLNLIRTTHDSSISFFEMYPPSMNLLEYRDSLLTEHVKDVVNFIKNPPRFDSATLQQWLSQFKTEAVASSYLRLVRLPSGKLSASKA